MAQDIVPITLALTDGDLVTLWAPRWREDGEEWEAFLGDDDHVFAFADAADLAAWIRTSDADGTPHDLADHPAWAVVGGLSVDELTPEDIQRYDVIGAPELVADEPDTWSVDDLAEITAMVRSLADVCDLTAVTGILDSTPAFAALGHGVAAFGGRDGAALWTELADVVAERWDDVLDALDALVRVPEVDAELAAKLRATATPPEEGDLDAATDDTAGDTGDEDAPHSGSREDAENLPADPEAVATDPQDSAVAGPLADAPDDVRADTAGESLRSDLVDADEEPAPGFWEEVGIDPISILSNEGEVVTLRCFLDDEPVFLGRDGRIDVFPSARALRTWIAGDGADGHDLAEVSTWSDVMTAAVGGDLEIEVAPENTYVLPGLAEDLLEGPEAVDPGQLELAVELLLDAADWAGDETTRDALAPSEALGWLVSFVLRPDPNRLTPSPPFQRESTRWRELEDRFLGRLRHP
ncbi:primosomal protein [Actinomycetospora sp. TBRC 11914]|uniref:primosomal protein n=1 Tax=Actinomycetospora sp. TBRC 11914 TaxID=2729387 RepID=UPI00145E7A06|nr:primosomal protein [Actinomycetospora sp. TBRC 11914]NMO92581.1 primosomal protein [Actinomycetospora sp. TBRC 11914]